ncbi:MAG: hypothetical protein NTV87_10470 [Ignavibacteriae bacterium]|nr:hypothetical protein [Ignavibacteriota bacterium]
MKNLIWVITASPGKQVTALPITISNINSKKPSENKLVTRKTYNVYFKT